MAKSGSTSFQKNATFISVIIPAFKQEKVIQANIRNVLLALEKTNYPFEIIVVVDGKVDNTFQNAKKIVSKNITVVGYEQNYGKGYAIRYGMAHAKGNIIGFIDGGADLNPNGLSMLLEHFKWYNADIIIGSKRHPVSMVHYPFKRRVLSFLAQMLVKVLFGLNIRDTQVGMKFFRQEVIKDVLPRLLVKKFAFDIEILTVAYHLGYKRIFEAPIELSYKFEESIVSQNLFRVVFKTFVDTLAIFYRLRILHYYDDKNKRKWRYDPELNSVVNIE